MPTLERPLRLYAATFILLAVGCDKNATPAAPVAPPESQPPVDAPAEAAIECDEAQACIDLGLAYFDGSEGKPRDHAAFLASIGKACELGVGSACLTVAYLHWGTVAPPGFEAYEGPRDKSLYPGYLEQACTAAAPASHGCNILGVMHARGEAGVTRDIPQAVEWFSRGCALELPTSCFELALLYESEPDAGGTLEQARALYEGACAQGDAKACNNLGFMHESGNGVPKDKAKAFTYYERACALGHEAAYCAPR